jgi:hypothetical protein
MCDVINDILDNNDPNLVSWPKELYESDDSGQGLTNIDGIAFDAFIKNDVTPLCDPRLKNRHDLQMQSDQFLEKYQKQLKKYQEEFLQKNKSKETIPNINVDVITKKLNTVINVPRDVYFGQMTYNVFGHILNISAPPLESIHQNNYTQKLDELRNYLGEWGNCLYQGSYTWTNPNQHFENLLSRLCRLKKCLELEKELKESDIKEKLGRFIGGNSDRCPDGKGNSLYDLEKAYVFKESMAGASKALQPWVRGGQLLFDKIQSHFLTQLKKVLNTFFAEGEPRTYAERRTINALRLALNLPGDYSDLYAVLTQYIDPISFLNAYLTNGKVQKSWANGAVIGDVQTVQIEQLTKDTLIQIIQQWAQAGNKESDRDIMAFLHLYDQEMSQEYKDAQSKVKEEYRGRFFEWTKESDKPSIKEIVIPDNLKMTDQEEKAFKAYLQLDPKGAWGSSTQSHQSALAKNWLKNDYDDEILYIYIFHFSQTSTGKKILDGEVKISDIQAAMDKASQQPSSQEQSLPEELKNKIDEYVRENPNILVGSTLQKIQIKQDLKRVLTSQLGDDKVDEEGSEESKQFNACIQYINSILNPKQGQQQMMQQSVSLSEEDMKAIKTFQGTNMTLNEFKQAYTVLSSLSQGNLDVNSFKAAASTIKSAVSKDKVLLERKSLKNTTQGITKAGAERILQMYGWVK